MDSDLSKNLERKKNQINSFFSRLIDKKKHPDKQKKQNVHTSNKRLFGRLRFD
jgi:hypothetical protein